MRSQYNAHVLTPSERRATDELIAWCDNTNSWWGSRHRLPADSTHSLEEIVRLCRRGADVLHKDVDMKDNILFTFVRHGHVEAVRACLLHKVHLSPSEEWNETEPLAHEGDDATSGLPPLKLTLVRGEWDRTLHWIFDGALTDEETKTILGIFLSRMTFGRSKEERDDAAHGWLTKDLFGENCLSVAARYQKLSLVWPLLAPVLLPLLEQPPSPPLTPVMRSSSEGSDAGAKISLPLVWEWDWRALEDKAFNPKVYFRLGGTTPGKGSPQTRASAAAALVAANAATARLCTLSYHHVPELEAVAQAVGDGADIFFKETPDEVFVFHRLCVKPSPPCAPAARRAYAAVCMTSPGPLYFSSADGLCGTPLHCVASALHSAEDTVFLLNAIIDRVSFHPEDDLRWGQRDEDGIDFLSLCGLHGKLSTVWPILKERGVRYYTDYFKTKKKLLLQCPVQHTDWMRLQNSDRDLLEPVKRFS